MRDTAARGERPDGGASWGRGRGEVRERFWRGVGFPKQRNDLRLWAGSHRAAGGACFDARERSFAGVATAEASRYRAQSHRISAWFGRFPVLLRETSCLPSPPGRGWPEGPGEGTPRAQTPRSRWAGLAWRRVGARRPAAACGVRWRLEGRGVWGWRGIGAVGLRCSLRSQGLRGRWRCQLILRA